MTRRDTILAGALVALGLNSLYLGARADAGLFYFANLGLHVALGLAAAVAVAARLRGRWRSLPALARTAAVALGLGALLGAALLVTGATRPFRPVLYGHLCFLSLGALLTLVAVRRPAALAMPRARGWVTTVALLFVAAPAVRWVADLAPPEHRITNPAMPPLDMEGEGQGPEGPFFPSSAETDVGGTIPSNFFMTAEECGRCHKDIYEQWSSSAHRFSSFNNQWYRKAVEYMQDTVGTEPSKWCAGCHDHALLFNGRFDTPAREQIDTPEAQAGLTCASCHSIVHVKSTMGQGDFMIEYPPLHDLAVSDQPALRMAHDYLLRLDPGPHSRTFLKSFHTEQTAEFCSSCHKVHLDVPVNDYRWVRGFNEYDNWQASGVSGQGARSFYYPPEPRDCADCHMPRVPSSDPAAVDGQVHSHRFPAANTALPFVNGDEAQLEVTQAFLKNAVTVDIFGIVRGEGGALEEQAIAGGVPALSSTFAAGEEAMHFGAARAVLTPAADVEGPLGQADVALRRGESARVEVVVRTRGVGHFFPGGTVDAYDVWVELVARDSNGQVLLHSGAVEDDGRGPVDPGAHFYRSLMLDERGNPINKRNAFATRSVAYVRLIPPGAADTVHFRLQVPEDCGDRIFLEARLNYRKFAWWNTQWAYAGVRDPADTDYSVGKGHDDGRWVFTGDTSGVSGQVKAIPNIPITVISTDAAEIPVLPPDAPEPAADPYLDASVRERWNDYGIGLLLQGDLRGAEAAFLRVTEMDPGYADGWVNVARARTQEGRMDEAGRGPAPRAGGRPRSRQRPLLPGHGPQDLRGVRPGPGAPPDGGGAVSPGPGGPQPDRSACSSSAPVPPRRSRSFGRSSPSTPRTSRPTTRSCSPGRAPGTPSRPGPTRRSTSASRPTSRRRRSPVPTASFTPTTTTSGSRCTSTGGASGPRPRPRTPVAGPDRSLRARAPTPDHRLVRRPRGRAGRGGGRDDPGHLDGDPSGLPGRARAPPSRVLEGAPRIQFKRGTRHAGLDFRHTSGAFGKKYLPETMGSGCAFLDYDNDGWLDVFLVNSTRFPGQPGEPVYSALFRNTRDGKYVNVTREAGLAVEMYGMGVAAADYDDDGWTDLYVTAVGGSQLFHNLGGGRFEDVTEAAVARGPGTFPTSAMFFDYDKDGHLDLVVANYVGWTIEADLFCSLDGKTKSYCTPESYKGESPTLLRNRGDGTFEDVTRRAGVWSPSSKALGVALLDHDSDGWPDFALANDTEPNQLFRNNGDGTFTEVGMLAGMAFDETGKARAGMGIDAADYAGTGRAGLLVANFSNEMLSLYNNVGNGLYVDDAPTSEVGRASLLTLAFSVFFFDYDLDGFYDIFAANGHVADDINAVQSGVTYAQPPTSSATSTGGASTMSRTSSGRPSRSPSSPGAPRTETSTTTATSTSSSTRTTDPPSSTATTAPTRTASSG